MSDVYDSSWSPTDASNTTAAPQGAPEGMAPSGVNDVLRAHQGAVKRFVNQQCPATTAGTDTAYTLAYTVAPGAYVDGMTLLVQFDQTNGAAPTLNVNSLGAKSIYYHRAGAWGVIPSGLIDTDEVFRLAYDSSSGVFRMVGFRNNTGEIREFAGSTVPAGALECDGSAVSRADYAGLFAVIGTTYGVGDGSTTFNLPDHYTRFVRGSSTNGTTGGADTHTHTVSGTASGTIAVNIVSGGPNNTTNVQAGTQDTIVGSSSHSHNVSSNVGASLTVSGTAASGSTLPAYIQQKKIIRT